MLTGDTCPRDPDGYCIVALAAVGACTSHGSRCALSRQDLTREQKLGVLDRLWNRRIAVLKRTVMETNR